jgi:polysaccharide export outer membrane protein
VRVSASIALLVSAILFFPGCATQPKNSTSQDIVQAQEPVVIEEAELGPGDVIEISVWRNDDLNKRVEISSTGAISFPLIGTVQIGGMSIFEVQDSIIEGLSEYLVDPQVGISVVSYKSKKIFVLGEVGRPGVFQNTHGMHAIEAISLAGGFTLDAAPNSVILVRGGPDNPDMQTLNLSAALKKADGAQNELLLPGDVLYVPASTLAGTERVVKRLDNILRFVVRLESGIILEPVVEDALDGESLLRGITLNP